jgi:hypothetical protein
VSYWVSGWIEIKSSYGRWQDVVNLSALVNSADSVSGLLFGLAKCPPSGPLFAERGVPIDASDAVRRDFEYNTKCIEQYGEADFGHTFATWEEILEVDFAAHKIDGEATGARSSLLQNCW